MEASFLTFISSGYNTTSVVLFMFMLVVLGWLVPKWRYQELKEELDEYKETTKSLVDRTLELTDQLSSVSSKLEQWESRNANTSTQ